MENHEFDFAAEPKLKAALKEFRASALAATERPEAFWAEQCRSVMARVARVRKASFLRPALAWGVAAVLVLVAVGLWVEGPSALPAPDFAVGYDDDLLSDVGRLTDTQAPLALEPALVLADEIEAGIRSGAEKATR